jgi:hypothetical protein
MSYLVQSQNLYSLRYQNQRLHLEGCVLVVTSVLVVFYGNSVVTGNCLVVRKPLLLSA